MGRGVRAGLPAFAVGSLVLLTSPMRGANPEPEHPNDRRAPEELRVPAGGSGSPDRDPTEDADSLERRPPQDALNLWPSEAGVTKGGEPGSDLRPSPGLLVREGSFLHARRGRMAAVRSGGWVYVFDADESGQADPPMVLLPCLRLMEMERLVDAKRETVTFQISGQVTAYDGRNHLLVTYFTTLAADDLRAPAPPAAGEATAERAASGQSPPAPGGAGAAEPSVDDLLKGARPEGRRRPGSPVPPGSQAAELGPETGRLLREGLTIAGRRGRIQRGGGGSWVFLPDNGAENPGEADPAMILQPCLNLERIERLIADRGDRTVLSLSGQIYFYQGRNYLLPTVYRVEVDREGNLGPGQ